MHLRTHTSIFCYALAAALMFLVCACGDEDRPVRTGTGTQPIPEEQGFYGWETVILRNSFTRIDVIPELGGKIIGYQPIGDKILWHNPEHEGEIDVFASNDIGEDFVNIGGAKAWPAPHDRWGGPPDRVLDGAPYDCVASAATLTVTGPADTESGRTGIQFEHTYSLMPQSTYVTLDLSMTNRSSENRTWSLKHLVTLPADRHAMLYVPVESDRDWDVIAGTENPNQWLGVGNGLFRSHFDERDGGVGLNVRDGWVVWFDAENSVAFALMFTPEPENSLPDGGYAVEISSTGLRSNQAGQPDSSASYMEVGIPGPLTDLSPGERSSMTVTWASCRCSAVSRVTPVGVISVEPFINSDLSISMQCGTFFTGHLEEFYYDKDGNQTSVRRLMEVSPLSEIRLWRTDLLIPQGTVGIQYRIRNREGEILGVLADIPLPSQ